jgi:Raf kinase inhibitor-like YbhB/YbcL family protein
MKRRFLASLPVLMLNAAQAQALTLTSPDIADGGAINKEQVYTRCGGGNISPALSWNDAPAGTKSLAITAIDLDVKPNQWSHWIVLGLPPNVASLGKGTPLPADAKAEMTDFGDAAYAGPCPPAGSGVHHYQFTVWALGTAKPQLPAHANANDVTAALQKNALAKASITGSYQR